MLCAETYLPSDWEGAGKCESWEGAEGAHPLHAAWQERTHSDRLEFLPDHQSIFINSQVCLSATVMKSLPPESF